MADDTLTHNVSAREAFPAHDDWQGWIDILRCEDDGTLDCVPECMRPPIMEFLTPDGRIANPNLALQTPLALARFMRAYDQNNGPPWRGSGITPSTAKRIWEENGRPANWGVYVPDDTPDAICVPLRKREQALPPEPEPEKPVSRVIASADLYIIRSAAGPIKIGVSQSPAKRLKQLQTAHPYKLEIACIVPGGARLEISYHERFAAHRLEGEWFAPHPAILAEIDRLNSLGRASA